MNKKTLMTTLGLIGMCLWFMPLVTVNILGLEAYQAGYHIEGIFYLVLICSFGYSVLSWMELNIPRIMASTLSSLITIYYLLMAGSSAKLGFFALTAISFACLFFAVVDHCSEN